MAENKWVNGVITRLTTGSGAQLVETQPDYLWCFSELSKFQDGDEIGFIYLGDPAAELSAFLAKRWLAVADLSPTSETTPQMVPTVDGRNPTPVDR